MSCQDNSLCIQRTVDVGLRITVPIIVSRDSVNLNMEHSENDINPAAGWQDIDPKKRSAGLIGTARPLCFSRRTDTMRSGDAKQLKRR